MALNVTEANAVLKLARWFGPTDDEGRPTDAVAASSLIYLAARAGQTLDLSSNSDAILDSFHEVVAERERSQLAPDGSEAGRG